MASNKVTEVGAIALADILSSNNTITSLSLAHNRIGPLGARSLKSALRCNSQLREFYLSGNMLAENEVQDVIDGWGLRCPGFLDLKATGPQFLSPRSGAYLVPQSTVLPYSRRLTADIAPPAA